MRRSQRVGTKYDPELDNYLDQNQKDLVDELITPHSYKLNEMLGSQHKIVSSVPAYIPDAQPTQARGRIVWNKSYSFQAHGPSYLDPVSDSDTVPYAK
jgi:hypothetical protein